MQAEPDWKEMYRLADSVVPKYVKDHDEREELKSVGVTKLLSVWTRFREEGPAKFTTWAARVMRNAMVDRYRKQNRKPRPVRHLMLPECNGTTKAELIRHYWPRVKPLLLPAELRVGEVYVEYGDLPYHRIAELAKVRNANTARVHACRIFKAITTLEDQES